ncbi:MAG: LVIVD repeat-containing protein [Candidatus Binatia bacterium]
MAQPISSHFAHNIESIGYHDLNGKPAFKLAMQKVNGRWYLYMAHLWHRGWSILDVTDPTAPEYVSFVPGPENTWTIQIQVAEGKMITALERIAPGWGGNEDKTFSEGFLIWNVADPRKPKQLGQYRTESTGTHRNFYDGGTLVHVAGGAPGFDGKIYHIVDISDPAKPRQVCHFALEEQKKDAAGLGKSGVKFSLHGPAHIEGHRAYLSYGDGGGIILDVSDIKTPRMVSQLVFQGLCSRQGIHTYLPLPRRRLALINDEAINENGDENLNLAGIVDIGDENQPRLMSLFPLPSPPPESRLKNFYEKGGRFGPHNQHHPNHQPCLEDRDDLAYLTYFNAGLRVYDIRDPRAPKEIAYFIPPDPTERIGTKPSELVPQVEDVLVDRRGCIYISEKNQGIFILRLKQVWPYGQLQVI